MNGIEIGYTVKNIFNGEIGVVRNVSQNGKTCKVRFQAGIKTVLTEDLQTVSGDIFDMFTRILIV